MYNHKTLILLCFISPFPVDEENTHDTPTKCEDEEKEKKKTKKRKAPEWFTEFSQSQKSELNEVKDIAKKMLDVAVQRNNMLQAYIDSRATRKS